MVFSSRCHDVNTCCIDVAMAKDIGQFRNVLLDAVKGAGEQLAQIVWKYL